MRRSRSTQAEIIAREQQQAEIIAELMLLGADDVAARVVQCWHDRLFGDPSHHRRRCRSISCLSCRRPPLAAWWRSFVNWSLDQGSTSYFCLPPADPLTKLPVLAKRLRNLRDRLGREESWLFNDMAFFGITDGSTLHVVVSHPGISRGQVVKRLRVLWPGIVLDDVPAAPSFELSPRMLARLGAARRCLQPCRFVILPRASA